jgi:hypothetical protein
MEEPISNEAELISNEILNESELISNEILNESEQIVIVPGWNVDIEDVVHIHVETDHSKLYV